MVDETGIIAASKDVSEQMQQIAETNSAVAVEEYAIPDASCFDTEKTEGGVSISAYHGDMKAIEIPNSINGETVCAIESGAFTNAEVTGVKIPDSVTIIKEKAFYYCTTLVEVELGSGVEEMGYDVFHGCLALSRVKLNEGLKAIGDMAFANTPSLNEISLPESLERLGESAFVLSGIHELKIPGNIQVIEQQICSTCANLELVTIEEGVQMISNNAFEDCQSLMTVEIPSSVQEIEELAFMYTDQVTIIAPVGSTAEAFARETGLSFSAK